MILAPTITGESVASLLEQGPLDRLERRILLAKASGLTREAMARAPEALLDGSSLAGFRDLVKRRLQGEPIAYLVGEREFYGRSFAVDPRVLIPRPETELLIDLALAALTARSIPQVLDVGCGSGAVAITIKCERPDADVEAIDISDDALIVARGNALRHQATIGFHQKDLRALARGQFDLILANLPYIASMDPHLGRGDLRFEPRVALTDENDGLSLLAALSRTAPRLLAPQGLILLEHGYDQAGAVRTLLSAAGLENVASWRDLAGIERITGGTKNT